MSQIQMSMAFLGGFALVGVHTHTLLHLSLGATCMAMAAYVVAVLLGLGLNLWFMAGQVFTLDFLAKWEPTSCVMEWLHDTIFGISDERMAAAYTVGSQSGRRSIDGKRYVQYIVPRRTAQGILKHDILASVPYPFSIGGAVHFLFFAAEDPHNPDHFVRQMMRSVTAISVIVVLTQTWATERMYHSTVLYSRAYSLQLGGNIEAAAELYRLVIKQDPSFDPFVAAAHQTHLINTHPWAAGMYVAAARFQAAGRKEEARGAMARVRDEAPTSPLVKHALDALAGRGGAEGAPGVWIEAVFNGYAGHYDEAMSRLGYASPKLLADAVKKAMGGRHEIVARAVDLGCGTGLMGKELRKGGGAWAEAAWVGVDLSGRMLDKAKGTGAYHSLRRIDMLGGLASELDVDLVVASDALRYTGDLVPLLKAGLRALTTGGLFALTLDALEHSEGNDGEWALQSSGGYAHSMGYVKKIAKDLWYDVVLAETVELRWVAGKPVMGHVVVLRKAG